MVGQEIDIMPIFSLCALDIIFGNYFFIDEFYYKVVQWKSSWDYDLDPTFAFKAGVQHFWFPDPYTASLCLLK